MTVLFFLCTLLGILARQAHAKAVFAHFMVGNANNYTVADWQTEISLAQAAHIDAFALNIAQGDKTIASSLELAFQAAGGAGFQLFFSFDYAGGDRAWSKQEVIDLCSQYCANGAYYHYNGKPFISTFEGPANAEDWHDIKSATSCFFMPDWSSSGAKPALQLADGVVDGLFNWAAWPWGNQDMDTYIDASYIKYLDEAGGKPYMMPASPWFYTNLPGYNKNWMWRGDDLWYDRWVEIIYNQPEFVEIISWNDFGESHYIGPLVDKAMEAFHIGKAPYNYATDMPHDGWRAFLPFLIDTYKSGRAMITQEGLVAWYRLSPAAACKDGGTVGNTASQLQLEFPPAQVMQDKVFFSALLTSTATVTVTVGPVTKTPKWSFTPDGGVGVYHGSVSFEAVGEVTITLSKGSQQLAQIKGPKIELFCPSGITNWNAWVGSQMASGGVSATPTLKTSEQKCIEGTGAKNFAGLCKNACKYGYCPVSACVCKAMGKPVPTPTTSGAMGYPLPGEDASYSGMCEYNCLLGYCPSDACGYDEVPLAIATVSAFLPPACTGGKARDSSLLDDLCSWTCKYGFCPIRVCTCTQQGALKEPPAQIDGHHGGPVSGLKDEGLCEFACSRGDICPAEVCVDRSPSAITSKGVVPKSSTGDAATWASDNGQECVMTDCLDDKQVNVWDKRFGIAPNGGPFKDNCGSGKNKYILCPIDAMPSTCQWRGGETGCSCHGQCHATEVTLFHSSHGSKNCCKPGQQAFCCVSDTWSSVVDSCSFSESDECPSDKKRNGYRNVYKCEYGLSEAYCGFEKQALCCAAEFDKCHWIGKGTCDDNECASYEVELALDRYGDTKSQCAAGFNGRKKVLCCTPPHKLNPFIGVSLDKLFPTLPPPTDVPDYDLEHIRFDGDSPEAFGFVVIDGPPDVVTSLTKRDGSHIEFLDCEPSKKHNITTHTVRYICLDASDASNCDDIHIGGAPGTIVKLPEGCGFATYGVVSEVRESNNPFVPAKFHRQAHDSTVVYEMDFTYDFSLTKRTSEPVYVRIDYSHIHDYWTQVVAGDSIMKRSEPGGLLKRFWSTKSEIWGQKLKTIRAEKLPGSYQVSLGKKDFSQLLYQEDNSGQCGGNGFLSVNLKGSVTSALRWGFTMVGTISPSLKFEEAYGFFDVDMSLAGTLSFDGRGELGILGRLGSQQLFDEHISDFGWAHPG
ncbi:mutanase [Colletotrichum higginsianum]|nr:mutanase [Colletotrichum higginsianum]